MSETMCAIVLTGHGDLDKYQYRTDWPKPAPAAGEVLIRVKACGMNNTDVNTRSGWYSQAVKEATTGGSFADVNDDDPTWGAAPLSFPRIQGADVCGLIEAVGAGVDPARIGQRVITDNWLRDPDDPENMEKTGYFGSERNGGYAEYTTIPTQNALEVKSNYSDAELATFSCSYSTAEGMLTRAHVGADDTVLVPGASGGVGGALIQLAKLRGARVIALASEAKHNDVRALGADRVLARSPDNIAEDLSDERITVLADVVGGPAFPTHLELLARGGRYTCSGAIAGPMVELDLRTFYLRDLTFTGSTVIAPEVTQALVRYIEAGLVKPALAAAYPLKDLAKAQAVFIEKKHTGNIVVVP